jgi:preprotein translocase subunit SecD
MRFAWLVILAGCASTVTAKVQPQATRTATVAARIIEGRLDELGVQADVVAGANVVSVTLVGPDPDGRARKVATAPGGLRLVEVDVGMPDGLFEAAKREGVLSWERESWFTPSNNLIETLYLRGDQSDLEEFLADHLGPRWHEHASVGDDDRGISRSYFHGARHMLVRRAARVITASSALEEGGESVTTGPVLVLELDAGGRLALERFTRRTLGRKLLLLAGERILAAPIVMEPLTSGRLTFDVTDAAQADELAAILSRDPLPAGVTVEVHGRP